MKNPPEFDQTPVSPLTLAPHDSKTDTKSTKVARLDAQMLKEIDVSLEARLGFATLSAQALMELTAGAVVPLDLPLTGLVELRLNQSTIARGEMVAVGDQFGIRIVEIADIG